MPYLLLCLSAVFWSGNFVLSRGMHNEIPPFALSFWRWSIALLLLVIVAGPHLRRQKKILWQNRSFIVVQGLLGVAGFNTLIYLAVQHTTAINTVLVNSCSPITIAIVSWLFYQERIRLRQGCGILLSLSGVLYIISGGNPSTLWHFQFNVGDLLVLVAGCCWAFYSANFKRYPQGLHPLAFQTAIVIVGVCALFPFWLWELSSGSVMEISGGTILTIGYVAFFASVLAFIFWNRGVTALGANVAGSFIHLMPVFSTFLAVYFLGEHLTLIHLVGVGCIFSGIFLTTVSFR